MKQSVKHSKIKNTGILFELLTRQVTADILNANEKSSKAVKLVKKYFNERTEIGKENQLYNILINKNFKSENKATYLVDAVIKSRQSINNSVLKREKFNLIKDIKENYNVSDFFKVRIPNYKILASIYKVFHSSNTHTDVIPITEGRYTIIEYITRDNNTLNENKKGSKLKEEDKDVRLLSYQLLVDKFNAKYSSLNDPQRKLLREYVNNISNTNSLKEVVSSEVSKVTKILKNYLIKVDDKVTKIKLSEVINQIPNLKVGNVVKDKQIVNLMRYYELIKELENVIGDR